MYLRHETKLSILYCITYLARLAGDIHTSGGGSPLPGDLSWTGRAIPGTTGTSLDLARGTKELDVVGLGGVKSSSRRKGAGL